MTTTTLRLATLALVSVLTGATLSGCEQDAAERGLAICDEGGLRKYQGCFDYTATEMHCLLESLRDLRARGRFTLDELPRWAITEERNGAPIIYDLRAKETPFIVTGDAIGRLEEWARAHDVPVLSGNALQSCATTTTEEEVREAEGGPPGTTTWEFDRRVSG